MLMPAGAIEKDFQQASGLPCATSACGAAIPYRNFLVSGEEQPDEGANDYGVVGI